VESRRLKTGERIVKGKFMKRSIWTLPPPPPFTPIHLPTSPVLWVRGKPHFMINFVSGDFILFLWQFQSQIGSCQSWVLARECPGYLNNTQIEFFIVIFYTELLDIWNTNVFHLKKIFFVEIWKKCYVILLTKLIRYWQLWKINFLSKTVLKFDLIQI